MHEIDISDESSGLLVVDSSVHGDDLEFYIYNYHNQDIKIDVPDAQDHDILIREIKDLYCK
jgi:hypothetical protein